MNQSPLVSYPDASGQSPHNALLTLAFPVDSRPASFRCFPRKFFSLFRAERSHAGFHAFPLGGLPTLTAHFSHHFGNNVASHLSIL